MKLFVPDYYKEFHCIADRCRHNCCIGWEIDIDEDTLDLYQNIPDEFGERLRDGISFVETPCFKLSEGERCVFLNDCGLCDIILNLGKDALCDICTDHPRFRNFFADRTEIGLGLCCEEACRLILGQTEPVKLEMIEDDGEDVPDPEEEMFFAERRHIFDVLQDRSIAFSERLALLSQEYSVPVNIGSPAVWTDFYRSLERLDSAWDKYLDLLSGLDDFTVIHEEDTVWENLAVYLVYRHSANYSVADSIAFCIHTVELISALCNVIPSDFNTICEICRMWSCEIEYSTENTEAVMEKLTV